MKAIQTYLKSISLLIVLFLTSCQSTGFKPTSDMKQIENSESAKLLNQINEINNKSFKTLKATFKIKSRINDKPFNASGVLYFKNSPFNLKVKFSDLIFQSQLMQIKMDSNSLKTYLPIENKVYINRGNFSSAVISQFNLSPIVITQFALGRIPLINNYRVSEIFEDGKKDSSQKKNILVLENNIFKQTIVFKNNYPSQIQLRNIKTGDKYELYLSRPVKRKNGIFYKRIRAYSRKTGDVAEITYNKVYYDLPLKSSSIFRLNLLPGTKQIVQ